MILNSGIIDLIGFIIKKDIDMRQMDQNSSSPIPLRTPSPDNVISNTIVHTK